MQEFDSPTTSNEAEQLPFPFNQRTFCPYEPIEKRIETARVLIVDNLLRDERDLSDVAREEWGASAHMNLTREREIAGLAVENIRSNVERLVRKPETEVVHLAEVAAAVERFRPHAIVLSGTLRDFDYYHPAMLEDFERFIRQTQTPVLGICGGHQLVGQSFGVRVVTLDDKEPRERRDDRVNEYQYRFIRIIEPEDPIFCGINDRESTVWQDYTMEARVLRVWQNHGLQLDSVPADFKLLATAYLCRNQMMVKRTGGQLIYTVQFHLEKSFEDWRRTFQRQDQPLSERDLLRKESKFRTRWEHPNESRDGRIIFENFLRESLKHMGALEESCIAE